MRSGTQAAALQRSARASPGSRGWADTGIVWVERPSPNPTTGAVPLHHTRTRRPASNGMTSGTPATT